MSARAVDLATRRWLPRAVVATSALDGIPKAGAALRRRTGRGARVELFFAFDDPASAVAAIELADRVLPGRHAALAAFPVVARGMPDDPAVELKRRYAVTDAGRLARRAGLSLTRHEPLDPEATRFLAEWVAAASPGAEMTRFCVAALRRIWFVAPASLEREPFRALWRECGLGEPPRGDDPRAVRANERRMRRRGPYDTPAAWVHGQWFFAHERLDQIGTRLDELGWTVAA
jgi:2-hydroxychromene-2-carboxylate isomerase